MKRVELAQALGIHPRTLDKFIEEGMPVRVRGRGGRPSEYEEAEARAWLAVRNDVTPEDDAPDGRRAQREGWRVALLEQTFKARQRKLIPAEERDAAWAGETARIAAIVESWRTSLAPDALSVALKDGPGGVERLLAAKVDEVLRELAGLPMEER